RRHGVQALVLGEGRDPARELVVVAGDQVAALGLAVVVLPGGRRGPDRADDLDVAALGARDVTREAAVRVHAHAHDRQADPVGAVGGEQVVPVEAATAQSGVEPEPLDGLPGLVELHGHAAGRGAARAGRGAARSAGAGGRARAATTARRAAARRAAPASRTRGTARADRAAAGRRAA